jgi:hypothetical protein
VLAVNKTDASGKSVVADEFFSVLIKGVEVSLQPIFALDAVLVNSTDFGFQTGGKPEIQEVYRVKLPGALLSMRNHERFALDFTYLCLSTNPLNLLSMSSVTQATRSSARASRRTRTTPSSSRAESTSRCDSVVTCFVHGRRANFRRFLLCPWIACDVTMCFQSLPRAY